MIKRPFRKHNPIIQIVTGLVIDLPVSSNISYLWNWGSLLGAFWGLQVITGIFLGMFYCVAGDLAFFSVTKIIWDINNGFYLRSLHANGASIFFFCVYIHIWRSIYYGGYMKQEVWNIGILIYLVMIATAFLGYILPWGQMSYWAGAVITNLFSVIPYIGNHVVIWLWGGYSVSAVTLNSFYSLHYLFPFILIGLVIIHLIFLHVGGSSNPVGVRGDVDKVPFSWYFVIKDLSGGLLVILLGISIIFIFPYLLGDAENFKTADPLVTPVHIKPEWYFLFVYAILRSIPNKLGGVIALISSLLVWVLLPYLHQSKLKTLSFRPLGKMFFWCLIFDFLLLTVIGGRPVEDPYILIGQLAAMFYFFYFLIIVPFIGYLENKIYF